MKKKGPLVSVCIANYNGIDLIDECLRSILDQEGDLSIEILIHDDASTDGSATYIRHQYPEVRLITSEGNVGFCIANNRMATVAGGQYLLLLNNDAILFPDALRTLAVKATQLEQPAILTLPQFDAMSGKLVDRGCLLDPFFNPVPNLNPEREAVAMVIGACLWAPKALWDELGGFPPWFASIAEDMYLCCKARLAGYGVYALPSSGYRHYQGRSFSGNRAPSRKLQSTYRRRGLSERNKTYVMTVIAPPAQLFLTLPLHLFLTAVEGLIITSLKLDARVWVDIYGPVFTGVWKMRYKLLDTRSEIQKTKTIALSDWLRLFVKFPHKLNMLFKYGVPDIR